MPIRRILIAASLVAGLAYAEPPKIVNDAPIIEDQAAKVDEGDVLAYLLRVPEEQRGNLRLSYDRLASVADGVFVARRIAQRAREEGLDKDPLVQRRLVQVQEAFLADVYSEKIAKDVAKIDLDLRAREIYKADPDAWRVPELFTVQHILVDIKGRTRAQALEKAGQVRKEAAAGSEDFLQLAARYSDDPAKTLNGGQLQPAPLEHFDASSREAIGALKKGETSEPIATDNGYEIYRLEDRTQTHTPTYEEVRTRILAQQRAELVKQRLESLSRDIRNSKEVRVHTENLDALVIPVDTKMLQKAQDELAKKLVPQKPPVQQAPQPESPPRK